MPSLNEILTKAGVTVPDGVSLVELVESSDEIKGLATAKNDLHQWKLENKPVLESLQSKQAELEAEKAAALQEKEQLAIQNKDYETLAQINAEKLQKLEDGLNASRERTKQSAHEAAIQSVASLFADKALGADIAATKVFTSLNDAGEPIVQYKMGSQEFTTVDDFKAALSQNASYASMMPVGGSNSAPAANGQGGQGGQQPNQPKLSGATKGYLANLQS